MNFKQLNESFKSFGITEDADEFNNLDNEYNLPLVKSLLLTLRDCFSSDYYGYLNSDILLSPDVFYILESLLTYQSSFTSSGVFYLILSIIL